MQSWFDNFLLLPGRRWWPSGLVYPWNPLITFDWSKYWQLSNVSSVPNDWTPSWVVTIDDWWINFAWDRNHSTWSWSMADVNMTNLTLPRTEDSDFEILTTVKIDWPSLSVNSGIFWLRFKLWRQINTSWHISFWMREWWTYWSYWYLKTNYNYWDTLHLRIKYIWANKRFYPYVNNVLIFPAWILITTFSISNYPFGMGDNFILNVNPSSSPKTVYQWLLYERNLTDEEATQIYNAWRYSPSPIRTGLIAEYRGSDFAWTSATPTLIYDIKQFTPATPVWIKAKVRLTQNWTASDNSQPIIITPYFLVYDRETTNSLRSRFDNAGARESIYTLWTWNRERHNILATFAIENGETITRLFIDGVKRDQDTFTVIPTVKYTDHLLIWRQAINFVWEILDPEIRIGNITDEEGAIMSAWWVVKPARAVLYTAPKLLPPWLELTDTSGNWLDFTYPN